MIVVLRWVGGTRCCLRTRICIVWHKFSHPKPNYRFKSRWALLFCQFGRKYRMNALCSLCSMRSAQKRSESKRKKSAKKKQTKTVCANYTQTIETTYVQNRVEAKSRLAANSIRFLLQSFSLFSEWCSPCVFFFSSPLLCFSLLLLHPRPRAQK